MFRGSKPELLMFSIDVNHLLENLKENDMNYLQNKMKHLSIYLTELSNLSPVSIGQASQSLKGEVNGSMFCLNCAAHIIVFAARY